MNAEDELLMAAGIHAELQHEREDVRAACVQVAQRLSASGRKVIGLLPAGDAIGVPVAAVQLGLALAEVSAATVAFVDANLRWPAISELAVGAEHEPHSAFAVRWLRGSLALLTAPRAQAAGAGVPQLKRLLAEGSELFGHVLVDLTGFKVLGEHLAALALVDSVVVVARAGLSLEMELLRLREELRDAPLVGVLLTGADA
jgi:hypothetical protein